MCYSTLSRSVVIVVLISFTMLYGTSDISAASHKRCNDYANSRAWQGQQAKKYNCGFKGPRWSTNYKIHYNWCRGVKSEAALQKEWSESAAALNKCKSQGKSFQGGPAGPGAPGPGGSKAAPAGKKQACNLYAHMAINHQHQNLNRKCGFKGTRWSTNWQHHYGWCMKVLGAKANAETKARQNMLKTCTPKKAMPLPAKPLPAKPAPGKQLPSQPSPGQAVPADPQQVQPGVPGSSPPPTLEAGTFEPDTDRPGQDYREFWLNEPIPQNCQKACAEDTQCLAWTYVKPGVQGPQAHCWLKHAVPQKVTNSCCVSGKKQATAPKPMATVPGQQVFANPSVEGYRVDWCVRLGVDCGTPAADAFCRLMGFRRSQGYEAARHIGATSPTRTLGAREICSAPECDGFASITCER